MRLPFPEEKPKRISPDEPMPTASYEQAREWRMRQAEAAVAEVEEEIETLDVRLGIGAYADDEERERIEEGRARLRDAQDALLDAANELRKQYDSGSEESGAV